ncbi:hypothetical protein [Bradyrhizobium cosmicum]|uniref:hypothetical protein n=1 Tax=Bradyrhizobium cosmicum TaxID=1404864 RepID=UPI0028E4A484|nr:hypothetical protein [Bradyrhizobium cosmicum]
MSDALQTKAAPALRALRYLAIAAGCACLLLAAVCFIIAAQVFIQTGVFAQSNAIVGLISVMLGCLALMLARVWKYRRMG